MKGWNSQGWRILKEEIQSKWIYVTLLDFFCLTVQMCSFCCYSIIPSTDPSPVLRIQTSAAQQDLIRWTHNLIALHVFNINAHLILSFWIFNQSPETFYVENCLSNALVQGSKEPVTNVHSVRYVILTVVMIMASLYHRDHCLTYFLSLTLLSAIECSGSQ